MSLLVYYAAQAGGQLAGPHIVPVPLGLSESITAIFQSSNLLRRAKTCQQSIETRENRVILQALILLRGNREDACFVLGTGVPQVQAHLAGMVPRCGHLWFCVGLARCMRRLFWGSEEMASSRFMTRWVLYAIHFAFRMLCMT